MRILSRRSNGSECFGLLQRKETRMLQVTTVSLELVSEMREWCACLRSISAGPSLLYNNLFPKHSSRLQTKLSELIVTVGKQTIPDYRKHFDVVAACEDENGEDLDVPLVSIYFR